MDELERELNGDNKDTPEYIKKGFKGLGNPGRPAYNTSTSINNILSNPKLPSGAFGKDLALPNKKPSKLLVTKKEVLQERIRLIEEQEAKQSLKK